MYTRSVLIRTSSDGLQQRVDLVELATATGTVLLSWSVDGDDESRLLTVALTALKRHASLDRSR